MLTYAFDLLVKIYEEEGYPPSEIAELILTNNLHGLEICPRATQLAQFALVCKAREISRSTFRRAIVPNVLCLEDVRFEENELRDYIRALELGDFFNPPVLKLLHQFEETKNFGSLIQPCLEERDIALVRRAIAPTDLGDQLFLRETHRKVLRLLERAEALTQRYHVVVANPPYMGFKQMNGALRHFGEQQFGGKARDLFGMFIQRCLKLCYYDGSVAMITMDSWMYGDDHTALREWIYENARCDSMLHLGPQAFDEIGGEVVQVTAFVFSHRRDPTQTADYYRLVSLKPSAAKEQAFLERKCHYRAAFASFGDIPRKVLAYQATARTLNAFRSGRPLREVAEAFTGLQTGDNPRFIHFWFEVSKSEISFDCKDREAARSTGHRWFPYVKGSDFRKWFGNNVCVLDWLQDGREIRNHPSSTVRNDQYYFQQGLAYNNIANRFSVRHVDAGFICDQKNSMFFGETAEDLRLTLGFLNSPLVAPYLEILSPKDFNPGSLKVVPILFDKFDKQNVGNVVQELIDLARADWDNFETSWDFREPPLLRPELKTETLEGSWRKWQVQNTDAIRRMQELETENNRLFIAAYGVNGELEPEVPEEQITLTRANRQNDTAAFLSYAVGCIMGRYSLDQPGLILADAGATVQDYLAKVPKPTFAPDEDAIIPVLDGEWFEDDIVARTRDFLRVTFGEATLRENLRFIEESLGKDLRKYFLTDFYKNHISNERAYGYKKRPIYWMIQSPKKGFNALIYLHRYNKDTMNLVLNRYLRPYQEKLRNRLAHLAQIQLSEALSTREKTAARKEADKLTKVLHECEEWERDTILPLAQQRIELDLDDGVKVNYQKLGEALAPIAGLSSSDD